MFKWNGSINNRETTNYDKFNTIILRNNANYKVRLDDDVFWVPTNVLGKSTLSNDEIKKLVNCPPQEIRESVNNLYEVIQYIQIAEFRRAKDNIRIKENKVDWEHHKPGYIGLKTNEGSCATISNVLNYLLKDNYSEIGFIEFKNSNGNGHVFNYIKQGSKYYMIDLTAYRTDNIKASEENGNKQSYNSGNSIANLHETTKISNFISYYVRLMKQCSNEPPCMFVSYVAENVLPVGRINNYGGTSIYYPNSYMNKIVFEHIEYNDNFRCEFLSPFNYPVKWKPFNTIY